MSHTPGPWKYALNVGPTKAMIVEEDGSAIIDITTVMGHRGELEANARLIVAAPDLLAALQALVPYTEACEGMLNATPAGQVTAAHTAIAKALGTSS